MGSESSPGRLLHQVVDELAETQPDQLYCIHPVSMKSADNWRSITYQDLAHAVNRIAFWIDQQLGDRAKQKRHVLAYIGTNDVRYAVFILACMKTGNTVRGIRISSHKLESSFNIGIASLHPELSFRIPASARRHRLLSNGRRQQQAATATDVG